MKIEEYWSGTDEAALITFLVLFVVAYLFVSWRQSW